MLYPTLLNRYVAIDNCHRKVYQGIKDHLGNICAVVRSSDNTPVQRTTYYASGVPMAENLGPDVPPSLYYAMGVQYTENFGRDAQPYLYNGKEFIEAYGLNEYDSQARWYYAPIMRTTTMDPMAESYYHISPYAWCGNNPINAIDPDGRDWYKDNDGNVFWKDSHNETITLNDITYTNIGENYNDVQSNTTYKYHQNELQEIEYSTKTEFRQQTTGTGCKTTCEEMVRSAGYSPERGRDGEILMATHDANGVVNGPTAKDELNKGLNRLEDYLTNGMPCIVGVDYKAQQQYNLAPNGDGMTDHFITIVGMTYDVQSGAIKYNFYDPGSVRGASKNNTISYVGSYLQGKTAAYGNPFKVTTIRKTNYRY